MRVLSLFDGMACGMLAMLEAGIDVERYVAFEIDKYAIQSATHNFPMIEERGDVFEADFTEFRGFDFLVGGSPCTYWSIAQKNNRETEASGMGWELFSQYVRALHEAQPRWFVYENNKSMSNAIRESITKTFGFEPICINSALVSAQNRNRLYWVGKREADGSYSKVHIEQPLDRGILLRDVLDRGCDLTSNDKAYTLTASYDGAVAWNTIERHQRNMVVEPVRLPAYGQEDKSRPLSASYAHKGSGDGSLACDAFPDNPNKQVFDYVAEPVNTTKDGKSQTIKAQYQQTSVANICCYTSTYGATGVAEPVCMRYERSEEAKTIRKQYESGEVQHGFRELSELHPRPDRKTNTLSTVLKDNPICEPVCVAERGRWEDERRTQRLEAREDGKTNALTQVQKDNGVAEPVPISPKELTDREIDYMFRVPKRTAYGYIQRSTDDKAKCIAANISKGVPYNCMFDRVYPGRPPCYAIPCEWDESGKPIKAISAADGKTYTVYEVKDGFITIKGKRYAIKLADGYYIIRKLTVSECKRLQTVPEFFEFPVSDSQALRQLGNGWTISVISHLIKACIEPTPTKDATFCNKDGEYQWF